MVRVADENVAGWNVWSLRLGMATEAKVGVVVHQQLFINGTVRVVTNRAAFAQRLVFKDERPRLRLVTARATFILPCHCQAALRFEDVSAVRVVAIHAVHIAFDDRMMLRQIEFGLHVQMTLETGSGIFSRIDDESGRAAGPNMFAARTMAGLASALSRRGRAFDMQPRMRTGGEFADNPGVAIRACAVADVVRARDFKRSHNSRRGGGA